MQLAWLALLEVSQAVRHHFPHSLLQVFPEILKRQNEMAFAFLFLAIGSGGKPPWDRRREGGGWESESLRVFNTRQNPAMGPGNLALRLNSWACWPFPTSLETEY